MNISLIDVEEIMPKKIVTNDYFGEAEVRRKHRMFTGTVERRHMEREELASDYFAEGAKKLFQRLNLNPQTDVDMILTNVSIPDQPFTGCGAVINKKIEGKAKWIFDVHNTGCISFLYLVDMAQTYMQANKVKNALICVAQTAAGRIFGQEDTRQLAQAAIPGDGFAVAYVTASDERPILSMEFKNFPEYSEDMYAHFDGPKWWESRTITGRIDFNEDKSAMIMARGNKAVPEMIHKACQNIKVKSTDISYLITNQPNKTFLRNWREAAQLPPEKHLDTFEKYANLFGAGIPVTLAEALKNQKIKKGDLVCLAGFSHACDYSGAALIRW
ncbi:3-oxoacyl-ACP synthase [Bdellovibrio sp. qaytius]|nr:3-oxoacyl-ACP synthase [Bdellovibrio sp. qaytius]